ncbi:unnamed protein product [Rotaria socialis]|uniref:Uncharacterized protein n=1 Tax=Rotaria socialis TaxID=392032 RepID=A0A821LWF6_9BILA|nr:unnamed protein product [Rotaria socialis]CAF4757606.1 unnamed protein product [Rotaria socialis]
MICSSLLKLIPLESPNSSKVHSRIAPILISRDVTIPIQYWDIGIGIGWYWWALVLVGIGIGGYWYWSVLVLVGIGIGRYWYWYWYWYWWVLVSPAG